MSINRGLAKYNIFIGQNPLHLLHKMKPFSLLYWSVERKKKKNNCGISLERQRNLEKVIAYQETGEREAEKSCLELNSFQYCLNVIQGMFIMKNKQNFKKNLNVCCSTPLQASVF